MHDQLTQEQMEAMKKASNRLRQKIWRETHPESAKSKALANYKLRLAQRTAFIDDYKLQHGCSQCGYKEHPCALDFHHPERDGGGKGIGKLKMGKKSVLLAEMKRCEVLCANCHRVRHYTGRPYGSMSDVSFFYKEETAKDVDPVENVNKS